jgi:aminoglycoside phosphotransferase family enzyme
MLASGSLAATHIDALAAEVAAFHGRIDVAPRDSEFGTPETVQRVALQNFDQIRPLLGDAADLATLARLHDWTLAEHAARREALRQRHDNGFVRECHGDLHLGNIAVLDGKATVFDCIEFNAELRWIDVMSEVAFTVMDLEDRERPDYAFRFLNAYLEHTGDYWGLAVLPFCLPTARWCAKVACLRGSQLPSGEAKGALAAEYRGT